MIGTARPGARPAARLPGRRWELPRLGLGRFALSRSRALTLAYLTAVVPALVMAFVQPVWQLTDEAQHADVLVQYEHGRYPIEGLTTLSPATVAIMNQTGVWRWSPPEQLPSPDTVDAARFHAVPAGLSGYNYKLWVRRHIWWFSYEAMQPPLFYAAATPVWMAAEHLGGSIAAVYAVRVLNSLLLALLAPLALFTAWRVAPGRRGLAAAAAVTTALLPGLLLNGSQITNDTLGAVLGAATVLAALVAARQPWTRRTAVWLGALVGLTLLAKLTAAGLAGAVAAAWVWPLLALRGDRAATLRQLRRGVLGAAAMLAVLSPWFALNLALVHTPMMNAEAARLLGAGTSAGHYSAGQDLLYAFSTWWTGEHQWSLPLAGLETALATALAIVTVVGLQRVFRGNALPGLARPELQVLAAAVAGQAAWALAVPFVSGLGGMTPGRYLYPVVVPSVVLLMIGAWAILGSRGARIRLVAAFAALTAANLAGYAAGYTGVRHEERVGAPVRLHTLDVYGAGSFKGVSITVDRLIDDPGSRWLWIHVDVRNDAGDSADWWPGPAVRLAGEPDRVRGDYAASTPFPETLPPGSEYSGWVKLLVHPEVIRRPGDFRLTFEDVAANNYRDLGSIPMTLALPPR